MRIFGITVIKNEADIIEWALTKASEWADKIFVLDNGSQDGTWEIVCELAKYNKVIIPWKQTPEPFTDGMRADVFNHFKAEAKPGDWWCLRLDADEFYIDDPRIFLQTKIKSFYHVVCSKHIQYRVTKSDVAMLPLPAKELLETLRYYEQQATSEIRFFKHRKKLIWNREDELPKHVGLISPERIFIKHYQYRSVQQIQNRILSRFGLKSHSHIKDQDWKSYILRPEDCIFDSQSFQGYHDLPLSNNSNLRYRWWVFWLKRTLHFIGIFP